MSILAPDREPASRYQPPGRSLPPLPPRWAHAAARARRPGDVPLWRFVFLSMLLHVLAILTFGAPSGGSREGRAMWGSLDVVIRDSFQDAAPVLRLDRLLPLPAPAPATRMAPPPAAPVVEPPKAEAPSVAVPPMLDRLERPPEAPEFTVPKAEESAPQAEPRVQPAPMQATPLEPLPAPAP
ncbi:MAG TPA: hypothetical protein VFP44_17880, partial [Usitatibacter sp.]|nr:hypothetical protein [Usitatibacter sp.]